MDNAFIHARRMTRLARLIPVLPLVPQTALFSGPLLPGTLHLMAALTSVLNAVAEGVGVECSLMATSLWDAAKAGPALSTHNNRSFIHTEANSVVFSMQTWLQLQHLHTTKQSPSFKP